MQILGSLSRELTSLCFGKTQTPPSPAAAQRGRGAKLLPAPLPPAPGGWLVYCIPCWDVTRGTALELPSSSYSLPPAPSLQGRTPRHPAAAPRLRCALWSQLVLGPRGLKPASIREEGGRELESHRQRTHAGQGTWPWAPNEGRLGLGVLRAGHPRDGQQLALLVLSPRVVWGWGAHTPLPAGALPRPLSPQPRLLHPSGLSGAGVRGWGAALGAAEVVRATGQCREVN